MYVLKCKEQTNLLLKLFIDKICINIAFQNYMQTIDYQYCKVRININTLYEEFGDS